MLHEGLKGLGILVGYYIVAASALLMLRKWLKLPQELFRKILHLVCVLSVFVYVYAFVTWYLAALTALGFAIVLYPVITFAERYPKFMKVLSERKKGEIKKSLMIVHLMVAGLITIYWGWMGDTWKYIIIVAVMAWGFGDAAAALVGKAWGRRKINHRWVDGNKTIEGTLAMYFVSGFAILLTLIVYSGQPLPLLLLVTSAVAPICAIVELISHNGMDTITVPFSAAIPAFVLLYRLSWNGM